MESSEATTAAATTVDDVHDLIDKLVLSIFETMRTSPDNYYDSDAIAANVGTIYKQTVAAIDNLTGINHKEEEQLATIKSLSEAYDESRKQVLLLESELIRLQNSVDIKLQEAMAILEIEQ